jgi:hypothetical protein
MWLFGHRLDHLATFMPIVKMQYVSSSSGRTMNVLNVDESNLLLDTIEKLQRFPARLVKSQLLISPTQLPLCLR